MFVPDNSTHCETFRDLLQPGEHLGQFLLPLSQLTPARKVHSEQSHDGVDDLTTRRKGKWDHCPYITAGSHQAAAKVTLLPLPTSSLNTPPSSWNFAATKSSSSIWCSPDDRKANIDIQRVHYCQELSAAAFNRRRISMIIKKNYDMFRTGIGPSIQHIIQHSILVHIKPVSDVSQSVWTTGIRVKGIWKINDLANLHTSTLQP